MGIIYKAEFSNGKSYIGYTKYTLAYRRNGHLTGARSNGGYIFHKAIRKYGEDDINWSILEEDDDNDYLLNVREAFHIVEQNSHYTKSGYNISSGGQGGDNMTKWIASLTEEQHEEYSKKMVDNLRDTWDSEVRFDAIRKSWANDTDRKEATSERMKAIWDNRTQEDRDRIKAASTAGVKQAWSDGKYDGLQEKATAAAAKKIKGSKWFNDGQKNYRLQVDDVKASNLIRGKLPRKQIEK